MSFVPEFAPDARSQWRELEPALQELVLDEIERLVASASTTRRREFYHDLRHERQGTTDYVFLRIHVDRVRRVLTVAGVVHYVQRPAS